MKFFLKHLKYIEDICLLSIGSRTLPNGSGFEVNNNKDKVLSPTNPHSLPICIDEQSINQFERLQSVVSVDGGTELA